MLQNTPIQHVASPQIHKISRCYKVPPVFISLCCLKSVLGLGILDKDFIWSVDRALWWSAVDASGKSKSWRNQIKGTILASIFEQITRNFKWNMITCLEAAKWNIECYRAIYRNWLLMQTLVMMNFLMTFLERADHLSLLCGHSSSLTSQQQFYCRVCMQHVYPFLREVCLVEEILHLQSFLTK